MFLPRKFDFWGKKVEFTDFFTQIFRYTRGFIFAPAHLTTLEDPQNEVIFIFAGTSIFRCFQGTPYYPMIYSQHCFKRVQKFQHKIFHFSDMSDVKLINLKETL